MIHSVHTISQIAEARLHDLQAEAQTLSTLRAARPSNPSQLNLAHMLRHLASQALRLVARRKRAEAV